MTESSPLVSQTPIKDSREAILSTVGAVLPHTEVTARQVRQ